MNFEKKFIFELISCTTYYLPSFFIKKLKSKYQRKQNQVFNPKILTHCCYSVAEQVKLFKSGIILQGKVNSKSIPFSAPETIQRCFPQLDL